MQEEKRIRVNTSLGILEAVAFEDATYPGIFLNFLYPKGNGEYEEVGIALMEVKEAGEETGLNQPEFHLRPYIAPVRGSRDENGGMVVGKISYDAPFDDICLTKEDFEEKPE